MDRRIIFTLVLLGLLGAALLAYQPETPEEVEPEKTDYNITLGYLAATDNSLPVERFIVSLAEEDINNYCIETGVPWRFNFKIRCAKGQAQIAFDNTQEYADEGILLVGGYQWSSFLCSGARNIAKENNMTLISVGSTSPHFIEADNAFRLPLNDLRIVDPVNALLDEFGYDSVVIIQRGDGWADLITEEFEKRYSDKVLGKVRYPADTYEDFTHYLDKADTLIREGDNRTGVLLVTFTEAEQLLNQTADYPVLMNRTWFGTDGTANINNLEGKTAWVASQVGLYSPAMALRPDDEWYQKINAEYRAMYHVDMTFNEANTYDCCWLMAYLVLDTNTMDPLVILDSVIDISRTHTGITGDLSLDEYGDRIRYPYAIIRYIMEEDVGIPELFGYYMYETDEIEWIDDTT